MASLTTSSARRVTPVRSRSVTIVILAVVVGIGLVHVLRPAEEAPPATVVPTPPAPVVPTPVPPPAPTPTPVEPIPSPTAPPTPGATFPPEPRPTATPTLAPLPTRRPWDPTPGPKVAECLGFSWTMSGATPTLNQIFVQIDATNRCRRRLGPEEIWFEISGVRDGSIEHRVRAHSFDEVGPGRTVRISVGLPGSVDWYDEVRVELLR